MTNPSILAAFDRMWQHIISALGTKANASHTHEASDVNGLEDVLASVGGDWDMLIKTTDFTSDAENYTVVKGNATDIFTRCKAGEQLKVGLWVEYEGEDPGVCVVGAETVDAVGELDYWSWMNIVFGYHDGENENMWRIEFNKDGIENNTIYRGTHTYLYDKKIVKYPTNENGMPQYGEVGQFAVSDGNGGITWSDGGSSGVTIVRWE